MNGHNCVMHSLLLTSLELRNLISASAMQNILNALSRSWNRPVHRKYWPICLRVNHFITLWPRANGIIIDDFAYLFITPQRSSLNHWFTRGFHLIFSVHRRYQKILDRKKKKYAFLSFPSFLLSFFPFSLLPFSPPSSRSLILHFFYRLDRAHRAIKRSRKHHRDFPRLVASDQPNCGCKRAINQCATYRLIVGNWSETAVQVRAMIHQSDANRIDFHTYPEENDVTCSQLQV